MNENPSLGVVLAYNVEMDHPMIGNSVNPPHMLLVYTHVCIQEETLIYTLCLGCPLFLLDVRMIHMVLGSVVASVVVASVVDASVVDASVVDASVVDASVVVASVVSLHYSEIGTCSKLLRSPPFFFPDHS